MAAMPLTPAWPSPWDIDVRRLGLKHGLFLLCLLAVTPHCAHLLYLPQERASEILTTMTEEGWQLALHHFPATGSGPRRQFPVLICHGIMSNKYNWDLTDQLSLPAHLARQGFDTWAVELRASGHSQKPGPYNQLHWDYSLDDYVQYDLPALIDFVRGHSGRKQVHWVGHSMGGLVLFGYLQRVRQDTIRSAIAVASPSYLLDHNHNLNFAMDMARSLDGVFKPVPTGTVSKMGSFLAGSPLLADMRIIWNYDNISPSTARLAAANAVENISPRVVAQMVSPLAGGPILSADGQYNYTAGMERIQVPFFFVAGMLDQLAPPAVVMSAYQSVASTDKRLAVLGRANGYRRDYGHVDLCLGETAPGEVFPLLADWIIDHD